MNEPAPNTLRAARLKLALMFLLPMLAVGLATLVYYTGVGMPRATTNKGVLLIPPRQIDELVLTAHADQRWRHADEPHDWTLLTVSGESCDDPCRERLYLSRQVRLALGKNTPRVERMHLLLGAAPEAGFADYLQREHADLVILHGTETALRGWLSAPDDPDPVAGLPIFVVDQRGFAMMYHGPQHSGADLIKDLRFLLQNSREIVR